MGFAIKSFLLMMGIGLLVGFTIFVVGTSLQFGKCGVSAGPCYGRDTTFYLNAVVVDQCIDCPNGKIGFIHTRDTTLPIIYKIDKNSVIKWAKILDAEPCSSISLRRMGGMALIE